MNIFKRKRVLSVLLALCMALSLLPTAAFADGLPEPKNYEEFKQRVKSSSGFDLTEYVGYEIPWPAEADTLEIGGIITLKDDLEIPGNITLRTLDGGCFSTLSANGQPLFKPTVIIHGDVLLGPTDRRQPFDCNVTVARGGSIKGADSKNVSMRVGENWTLSVEEGASIDVHTVRLAGTLTGEGTVSSRISVVGSTSSGAANAVLSGSLTLTGWTSIGSSNNPYGYKDTLTIPAGSDIKFTDDGSLDITNCGTVYLQGKLELLGEIIENEIKSGVLRFSDDDGGELNMAKGSILTAHSTGRINGGMDPTSPYITGNGTIELYKNGDLQPYMFSKYPDDLNRNPQLFDKYIATTVTVKRTWVCDEHQWSDWATVEEATCGTSGEKTRACSVCGKMEFQYVAPTGEHSWNTSTWVSDSTGHWHTCANCEETTGAAAHTFGDWTVTQEATATAAGSQYRDCTVCGYRETGTIPAAGEPDNPVTPGGDDTPDTPTPPPTVTPDVPSVPSGGSGPAIRPSTGTTTAPAADTETKPDDSTTTKTDAEGNKTTTTETPNGSTVTTVENKDGGASTTTVSTSGQVTAAVTIPAAAVATAQASGQAAALPMPEVPLTASTAAAPVVTVTTGSSQPVKVEIPVERTTPGTVAVLVNADGTEEVVKTSLATANGVTVTVADGTTVKIVDNSKSFTDAAGHWASDAIAFATAHELFNGTGADSFTPDGTMTRGMMLTVLARYDGVDTSTGAVWYEKGVEWAAANHISSGEDLDAPVSREQLAAMLCRYAAAIGLNTAASGSLNGFPDAGSVSDYAVGAMAWAVGAGLIGGTDRGELNPNGSATRAEVATILMRFCENVVK